MFHWKVKGERRHTTCKECESAYHRDYYLKNKGELGRKAVKRNRVNIQRNKRRVFEYLSKHPCVDCGEPDPVVLDFDHVRGEKSFNVASMISETCSWERIEEEIRKCEVRCANCHRRKTAKEHGWYDFNE
jgi:hypothetical protein